VMLAAQATRQAERDAAAYLRAPLAPATNKRGPYKKRITAPTPPNAPSVAAPATVVRRKREPIFEVPLDFIN